MLLNYWYKILFYILHDVFYITPQDTYIIFLLINNWKHDFDNYVLLVKVNKKVLSNKKSKDKGNGFIDKLTFPYCLK